MRLVPPSLRRRAAVTTRPAAIPEPGRALLELSLRPGVRMARQLAEVCFDADGAPVAGLLTVGASR